MSVAKLFKGCDSTKASAKRFTLLSDERKSEFCALPVKKQARLLQLPDRAFNRFVREYDGQTSIMAHCDFVLNKKKAPTFTRYSNKYARQHGYKGGNAMDDAEQRRKGTQKTLTKEEQHAKKLARMIELEEMQNII